MSALTTRDALTKALRECRAYQAAKAFGVPVDASIQCDDAIVDALITSGAVIDAATLADDKTLVEAIADDQKEAADSYGEPLPGAERNMRARTALRALAAALTERAR